MITIKEVDGLYKGASPVERLYIGDTKVWSDYYPERVLMDGPVGYWRLGEPVGATTAVDSAGSNNGTYDGSTLGIAGAVQGDTAADFDGVNDLVSLPAGTGDALTTANRATAEAWVWLDSYPAANNYPAIITNTWASPAATGIVFTLAAADPNSTNRPWAGFYDRAVPTWRRVYGPTALELGKWHHLAATWDGGYLRMYVNGDLVATNGVFAEVLPFSDIIWVLGRRWDNLQYHDGKIDEVALYDKALTAEQIQAHYGGK